MALYSANSFVRFLSTPSARRATVVNEKVADRTIFLSTPSARRATSKRRTLRQAQTISIHALREEGDPHQRQVPVECNGFLSTPSARRATRGNSKQYAKPAISIHALREEGDLRVLTARSTSEPISIHALREEGDFHFYKNNFTKEVFLSTPSARRATWTAGTTATTTRFLSTPSARRATLRMRGTAVH